MPENAIPSQKKQTSAYLNSQIDYMNKTTNEYLNKNISDLDILSLPEHYPTEVHNVSSLAELYYLTQTLPLIKLLPGSHKTLMSENFELALLEGKIAVLYSRIEELKRQKKWSLRQPIRYYDPFLYSRRNKKNKAYHWDVLLEEAKWMAADFKESSKYKKACCFEMAQAVQDYWSYGKIMCIKRRPIRFLSPGEVLNPLPEADIEDAMDIDDTLKTETSQGAEITLLDDATASLSATHSNYVDAEAHLEVNEMLPEEEAKQEVEQEAEQEVEQEAEQEAEQEDSRQETVEEVVEEADSNLDLIAFLPRSNPEEEIVPQELPEFSLDDLQEQGIDLERRGPFKLHANINELKKIDLSIIRNLPKFTAFEDDLVTQQQPPLKPGETSVIPVSRMLYPMEQDDSWYKIVLRDSKQQQKPNLNIGPPEFQKGLFGVQSHRRFNLLKPPKPPLLKNIEYRSPTIWLPQDDKYLIHYVAEYCFNWDIIAENLSSQASTLKRYESNIERRTPWQCFERYIQLNDKFQFLDMKGINAYQAQQWLEHAHRAQLTTKRRISPLGVGNESIQRGHRRLRWASMFDAMRKTMRKRELTLAKANQRRSTATTTNNNTTEFPNSYGGNNSSMAGNGSAKRTTDRIPTPAELAKLKHDREKSIQEQYIQQQATRTRMMAAVSQLKLNSLSGSQQSPGLAGPTDGGIAGPTAVAGQRSSIPSRVSVAGSPGLQRPQSANATMTLQQQQQQQAKLFLGNMKRPTTPNGTPYTVEQIQQFIQLQKQKRIMQQQNQTTKGVAPATTNSSTLLGAGRKLTGTGQMPLSQGYTSSESSTNGAATPAMANKRTAVPAKRIQFAPAHVSAVISSIQQKNPNLTKEQVTKLAASYLANLQQQQQNRLEQQQLDGALASGTAQQSILTRQAATRQRLSGAKELDSQAFSKLQYEERKKLMMQQSGIQYSQGASSPTMGSSNAQNNMTPQSSLSYPSNTPSRSSSASKKNSDPN